MNTEYDVGVIVGRFQVPELHEAHLDLIQSVCDNHDKVIVVLGLSPLMATVNNPLDFEARKQMIQEAFPDVTVVYLNDMAEDKAWSKRLDKIVADLITPNQRPLLYGGRDSFIPQYSGKFDTAELRSETYISGRSIRKAISRGSVRATSDFRAGVVWAAYARFPTVYTTVDVAILNEKESEILLGRKENETGYRLIGGSADPASLSFEEDARREVWEEAGVSVTDPEYLGSFNINDWRYRNERDSIRTMLFKARMVAGTPEPGNDIYELAWFSLNGEAEQHIREEHRELLETVMREARTQWRLV